MIARALIFFCRDCGEVSRRFFVGAQAFEVDCLCGEFAFTCIAFSPVNYASHSTFNEWGFRRSHWAVSLPSLHHSPSTRARRQCHCNQHDKAHSNAAISKSKFTEPWRNDGRCSRSTGAWTQQRLDRHDREAKYRYKKGMEGGLREGGNFRIEGERKA